ncbi:GNAT family N-acetyltransferase [Streptomyces sp. JB150]|uniref:GNAT family N-acetyltransferase n=1 Tax=Streptomyces sp. JB150 TaxID=2714844 RepID=UPI0014087906|nr:GNAT family N-acetyltransferase [Streptomyces sp. JB150]QIJ60758.1 GNAT family N-acetyltransferase [Streptomyces sp. JB150]
MVGRVQVLRVDEGNLDRLLAVAVGDAAPEEVMPPVAGGPGWTTERQAAFRAWHRARRAGLAGPLGESTYVITYEGEVVGSARLALREGHDVLETGMWLGRTHRGRGIGTATVRLLLDEAAGAGARAVVADTTTHNTSALAALRGNGATLTANHDTQEVHAELVLSRTLPTADPRDVRFRP